MLFLLEISFIWEPMGFTIFLICSSLRSRDTSPSISLSEITEKSYYTTLCSSYNRIVTYIHWGMRMMTPYLQMLRWPDCWSVPSSTILLPPVLSCHKTAPFSVTPNTVMNTHINDFPVWNGRFFASVLALERIFAAVVVASAAALPFFAGSNSWIRHSRTVWRRLANYTCARHRLHHNNYAANPTMATVSRMHLCSVVTILPLLVSRQFFATLAMFTKARLALHLWWQYGMESMAVYGRTKLWILQISHIQKAQPRAPFVRWYTLNSQ